MDYDVKAVGLRFFTVYGPWGRPDMAVYKFAKKIMAGDTIVLHEHRSMFQEEGRMLYVFTSLPSPSQQAASAARFHIH